jgi:hypothetical protein
VVLHVPTTVLEIIDPGLLELREDLVVALAERVVEHVEPTAVGHPKDDLLHAEVARRLEKPVQQRDQALRALEAEPLLARVPLPEEPLEELGLGQKFEQVGAVLPLEGNPPTGPLEPLEDPAPAGLVLDVHGLDTDRRAVRFLESLDHTLQRNLALEAEPPRVHGTVEVVRPEPVVLEPEAFGTLALAIEWIEPRREVPVRAVAPDQIVNHRLEMRRPPGDLPAARRDPCGPDVL